MSHGAGECQTSWILDFGLLQQTEQISVVELWQWVYTAVWSLYSWLFLNG